MLPVPIMPTLRGSAITQDSFRRGLFARAVRLQIGFTVVQRAPARRWDPYIEWPRQMSCRKAGRLTLFDPRPQLRMRYDDLNRLPPLELPVGYHVRRFAAGDEPIWVALLRDNGELGDWDLERAKRLFSAKKGAVWRKSIHFIMHGQRPVATACVRLHLDLPDTAELGWVAVIP